MRDVAAVAAGRRPAEGIFLALGPVEEAGGAGEDGGDGGGGDAVVGEVEEAGGLEGCCDGFGGLQL